MSPTPPAPPTIDRQSVAAPVRVRLESDLDPFASLSSEARVRLLVRILCELVAYDARGTGQLASG